MEKGVWQGQGSFVSIVAAVVGIHRFDSFLLLSQQDTDCNMRWWVD